MQHPEVGLRDRSKLVTQPGEHRHRGDCVDATDDRRTSQGCDTDELTGSGQARMDDATVGDATVWRSPGPDECSTQDEGDPGGLLSLHQECAARPSRRGSWPARDARWFRAAPSATFARSPRRRPTPLVWLVAEKRSLLLNPINARRPTDGAVSPTGSVASGGGNHGDRQHRGHDQSRGLCNRQPARAAGSRSVAEVYVKNA